MTYISLMLFAMVGIGLARNRLGQVGTYGLLMIVILAYVTYAYVHPS